MAKFTYSGIKPDGSEATGKISADSADEATAKLSAQGIMVSKISELSAPKVAASTGAKPKKSKKAFSIGRPINEEGLTIFTRQLSTLLQAGLPLVKAIDVMSKQEKRPAFRAVLLDLADNVRSGNPFSDGLLRYPKVFDHLYVNMVRAGEAGGVLDVVLERLSIFKEKTLKTKKKVKSAMIYPIVVMVVAFLIVTGLMIFVVPKFQNIFNDMLQGAPLPVPTQILIAISNFITSNIIIIVVALFALFFGFKFFKGTPTGKKLWDRFILKLPQFGELFTKAIIARFTRTFSTLMSSGVPILQSILITRDILDNNVYEKSITKVHDAVRDGEPMAKSMEREKVFPDMVTSMVEVGEESGDLPEMLGRVADNYEEDVDNAVTSITSIIEPIMIVFLAVVVGGIVVALFLPIVKIIQTLAI